MIIMDMVKHVNLNGLEGLNSGWEIAKSKSPSELQAHYAEQARHSMEIKLEQLVKSKVEKEFKNDDFFDLFLVIFGIFDRVWFN